MANSGRPSDPSGSFEQAIRSGAIRVPANAGSFRSWDDALAGDEVMRSLPNDAARTSYARGMYQLPHPYQIKNGKVVDGRGFVARNIWWIGPAALAAPGAAQAMSGAPAAAAAAGGTSINAAGIPTTAAYLGAGVPYAPAAAAATTAATAGGESVAKAGYFSRIGEWLGSPKGQAITDLAGQGVSAYLQNRGANRALDAQSQYNTQALDYLKEQDARDFAEYLKERERDWKHQDEDRGRRIRFEDEREGRLAPFREGASAGYKNLASLLTLDNGRVGMPVPVSQAARPVTLADLLRG